MASYGGDTNFVASASAPVTQTVKTATSGMTLATSPNPSVFGQMVTFKASVFSSGGIPTGTVTFEDGATILGTGALVAGAASFGVSALGSGDHRITAVYGGDPNFGPSTSAPVTQTVQSLTGRAYVSGAGADSGACVLAAPCRSFAYALSVTKAGGEIDVIGVANYGPVTIDKAINIVNGGAGEAWIQTAAGANSITINAAPSDSIYLRGLTLDGGGAAANGIVFNSGHSLEIADCAIRHFTENGVNVAASSNSNFSIVNTIASDNGSSGVYFGPTAVAGVKGVLNRVTANNNAYGVSVYGGASSAASLGLTIRDSVASHNASYGIWAGSTAGHAAAIIVARNLVTGGNGAGVFASTNSVVWIDHLLANANNTGVAASGGVIYSYGDNDIDGNANDNIGVLTAKSRH